MYFSVFQSGFYLCVTFLSDAKLAPRKAKLQAWFLLLVAKAQVSCLCWPAVIFWQVTKLPFIQLSLVLSKAPPPRLYVRKRQNLLVYLKEAAAGRKNGTLYSRCHGAGYWWDWGQLVELVMSGVCFQLSWEVLLWCKDLRWSHTSWWVIGR